MQKNTSIIDPLFNRTIFALFVLSLFAGFGLILMKRSAAPSREHPLQTISSEDGSELLDAGHQVARQYDEGFRIGYDAFMMQTGQYQPRPAVSYSTSAGHSKPGDPESPEFQKGYADGYHRATELESCPRPSY